MSTVLYTKADGNYTLGSETEFVNHRCIGIVGAGSRRARPRTDNPRAVGLERLFRWAGLDNAVERTNEALNQIDGIVGEAVRRLAAAAHPVKIILFGSYARGDFDDRSDLDLLVIMPVVHNRLEEMVRLRRVLRGIPMAFDIVVYSTGKVEKRRELRGTMLYHALQEGRVLHDAA